MSGSLKLTDSSAYFFGWCLKAVGQHSAKKTDVDVTRMEREMSIRVINCHIPQQKHLVRQCQRRFEYSQTGYKRIRRPGRVGGDLLRTHRQQGVMEGKKC